jgi:hypothetical protein
MNKKSIIKFILVFIVSFLIFEGIEMLISHFFNIDLQMKWGWIGFIIFYGFKFHIFCCLIPALWAGYKCRHKKCHHEHCGK